MDFKDYYEILGIAPNADYGAGPLKRAIQHEQQDPLALKILSGDFHEGADILKFALRGLNDFLRATEFDGIGDFL